MSGCLSCIEPGSKLGSTFEDTSLSSLQTEVCLLELDTTNRRIKDAKLNRETASADRNLCDVS